MFNLDIVDLKKINKLLLNLCGQQLSDFRRSSGLKMKMALMNIYIMRSL